MSESRGDAGFEILVLGGSQGARILSAVIPTALARLPEPLRARLRITQQARPEDADAVRAAYAASGISAEIRPFFDDVPARLAKAQLAIARSGASTVAELTVIGRPAILVPYRYAADDHQSANARALEAAGAAWVMAEADVHSGRALPAHRRADGCARDPRESGAGRARPRTAGRRGAARRSRAGDGGRCSRGGRGMKALPLQIGTIHFVGIGGIGMSGIAEILHNLGYAVQGSDLVDGANVHRLQQLGISVEIGHKPENLRDAQVVVISSAVKPDNPEVLAARAATFRWSGARRCWASSCGSSGRSRSREPTARPRPPR